MKAEKIKEMSCGKRIYENTESVEGYWFLCDGEALCDGSYRLCKKHQEELNKN